MLFRSENDLVIESLAFDSRQVREGSLFFALPGIHVHGNDFAEKAIAAGARAVVYEGKKENPENRNLYLRLTNKTTDKNMRLDQGATVFEINGKKVEYKSIDSTLYDTRWYTKIAYYKDNPDGGDNIEGYIVLPVDIKPGDMIKITTYITIDGQKEKIPVVFKLDMNKIK